MIRRLRPLVVAVVPSLQATRMHGGALVPGGRAGGGRTNQGEKQASMRGCCSLL